MPRLLVSGVLAVVAGAVLLACGDSTTGSASVADSGPPAPDDGGRSTQAPADGGGGDAGGGGGGTAAGGGGGGSGGSGGGTGASSDENCQAGEGDFCACYPAESQLPPNSTPCSTTDLKDPGQCCAAPGWPSSGSCLCMSFLCYVNQGGGKDCFFQDLGENGLEVPTTSATGAACCVWGTSSSGYLCSCYDQSNVGSCDGKQAVSSCTIDAVPTCSSDITGGYAEVTTCR